MKLTQETYSDKETAKRLKFYRSLAGITQRQLTEETGLAKSSLVRCESGKARISASVVHLYAEACGVSADILLGIEDPSNGN